MFELHVSKPPSGFREATHARRCVRAPKYHGSRRLHKRLSAYATCLASASFCVRFFRAFMEHLRTLERGTQPGHIDRPTAERDARNTFGPAGTGPMPQNSRRSQHRGRSGGGRTSRQSNGMVPLNQIARPSGRKSKPRSYDRNKPFTSSHGSANIEKRTSHRRATCDVTTALGHAAAFKSSGCRCLMPKSSHNSSGM